ncbi:hypothetical protein LIER_19828 [Lithospermum erythrorhizon]|uniref:Uncharacterized protein n=1 Tax=Lithospermum erythrorhizon TaxID=34254 RepID=A0AAV3QLI2_LITER
MMEEVAEEPIVEDRVSDSSHVAMSETAGLIGPSVMSSVNDRCEPTSVTESRKDAVEDSHLASENTNVVKGPDPVIEDGVPDSVTEPSTEDLETINEQGVKDTLNVADVTNDHSKISDVDTMEGMSSDIPRVSEAEPDTEKAHGIDAQGVTDTLDEDIVIPSPKTKKSKKRKLKKISKAGPSEPKLSKEERAAKKARRAERRARKAARRAQRTAEADETVEKEAEENVVEEQPDVIPPVRHTSVDDDWVPEHEPQVNDAEDSDE